MFTAVVVTPEKSLAEGLERLAVGSGQVTVYKSVEHYPTSYELARLMNSCNPELLVIDLGNWERARVVVAKVYSAYPRTAVVGFGGGWGEGQLELYAGAGVAAFMRSPITLDEFRSGVAQAVKSVLGTVHQNLIAFLPAKAGSGCSLTAIHAASSLAEGFSRKVAFIEGDLGSGTLGVRLGLTTGNYVQDVLENPGVLNRGEWGRLVVKGFGVNLLPADGERPATSAQWNNYFDLIEFVAASYDYALVDLPEVVEGAAAELLHRAGTVCLVTAPSRVAIELARRRIAHLEANGIGRQRVSLIVNRASPRASFTERLEEALGVRVVGVLPDDATSLRVVELEGRPVARDTDLGRAYLRLAAALAGESVPVEAEQPKRPKLRLAAILGR